MLIRTRDVVFKTLGALTIIFCVVCVIITNALHYTFSIMCSKFSLPNPAIKPMLIAGLTNRWNMLELPTEHV